MTTFFIVLVVLGFVAYFCIAVFTAHRSRKGFWINFSVGLLALSGLAACHTDHDTPADGLVELFLAALFMIFFVLAGLAWLCSWLAFRGARRWRKP